jgi:hypothetical protein
MKDCFQDASKLEILTGAYQIPNGHPYGNDVLDLVSRMLEPNAEKRPDIHEVISFVDVVTSTASKSLPTKGCSPGIDSNHEPSTRTMLLVEMNDSHFHVCARPPRRSNAAMDAQLIEAWRDGAFDQKSNESTEETQVSSI